MATSIFFNGRRINVPQAASKIDASALAGVSAAAVGIVALVGTAEGGIPLDVSDTYDLTRAETALARYRGGNLRAATQFCFQPSTDQAVPGGAQKIVPVKVNPATQAEVTLADANAADSIVLTSLDYGLFTNQVNVEVATGTTQGKLITVVFEDETEEFDDVGGDELMSLDYTPSTNGYGTALATLTSTQLALTFTKAMTGLVAERTADIGSTTTVTYVSGNVADTTQTITTYGLDGASLPVKETITLNGTTNVVGTQTFSKVLGAIKSVATAGTVTLKDTATGLVTMFSLTAGVLTRGVQVLTNCPSGSTLSVAIDTTAAVQSAVFGTSPTGAAIAEMFSHAATPDVGTVTFGGLAVVALGDVAGARTVTITATITTTHASYTTIQKTCDRLNSFTGLTANPTAGNASKYLMSDLDYFAGSSFLTELDFTGTLKACIDIINSSSGYVAAERATGAGLPPANTTAPVYLTGGGEGTTTITQWQEAFTLLKLRRVNIIVPLTEDPAVHALLAAHLVERAGKLRSEANGYVGIGTSDGAGETKAQIKSQIQSLSTRHVSAISQEVERFDPDTGDATFYPPWMFAVIAAGMQAGSAIGEPMTMKKPTCTDIRNDDSWSVVDDIEDMIDFGLMVAEKVDGLGIRWVRSITTHLADDNPVFCEMSANESLNTAVFRFRRQLELKVGSRGLASSVATIKGIANDELGRLVDDEIIVAYQNLGIEQLGDVYPVSVEMAPILPINFIPITIHLTVLRSAA